MTENRRALQKTKTRRKLLEAALNRMAVDGPISTTTLAIAETAGVSHGTVFAHFPTREDLLVAVIDEFGERVAGRMHELTADGGGLREIFSAHLRGLAEVEGFYTGLVREEHLMPLAARDTLVKIQSAISLHISMALEREIRRDMALIPLHFFFNLWLGLIHHYLLNASRFAPGESVLVRCGSELIEHYLALVAEKS